MNIQNKYYNDYKDIPIINNYLKGIKSFYTSFTVSYNFEEKRSHLVLNTKYVVNVLYLGYTCTPCRYIILYYLLH